MYDQPEYEEGQEVCVRLARGAAPLMGTVSKYLGRELGGLSWYRISISGRGPTEVEGWRLSPYDEGVCGP